MPPVGFGGGPSVSAKVALASRHGKQQAPRIIVAQIHDAAAVLDLDHKRLAGSDRDHRTFVRDVDADAVGRPLLRTHATSSIPNSRASFGLSQGFDRDNHWRASWRVISPSLGLIMQHACHPRWPTRDSESCYSPACRRVPVIEVARFNRKVVDPSKFSIELGDIVPEAKASMLDLKSTRPSQGCAF
jgi:hypothetical protein